LFFFRNNRSFVLVNSIESALLTRTCLVIRSSTASTTAVVRLWINNWQAKVESFARLIKALLTSFSFSILDLVIHFDSLLLMPLFLEVAILVKSRDLFFVSPQAIKML
jgi:hypothetical protein